MIYKLELFLFKDKIQESPDIDSTGNFWVKARDYKELHFTDITKKFDEVAKETGCFQALWYPQEVGITQAKELLPYIEEAINKLPESSSYDSHKWYGSYRNFRSWLNSLKNNLSIWPESYIYVRYIEI